jgi:hypothetical protein
MAVSATAVPAVQRRVYWAATYRIGSLGGPYPEALKRTIVALFDNLVDAAKQRGGMASASGLM